MKKRLEHGVARPSSAILRGAWNAGQSVVVDEKFNIVSDQLGRVLEGLSPRQHI